VIAAIVRHHEHDHFWGPWEAFRTKACSVDSIRHYYTEDRQVIKAIERSRRELPG
jgi:hypothetical protein